MAAKKTPVKRATTKNVAVKEIRNPNKVNNGLTEAVLGFDLGFNPLGGTGVQLSQVTTIFQNLRWYLVSNMRQPLNQAYVEIGVIQTIVDVPVDDGMRGGVEIKSKELSPEEVEELQFTLEQEDDLGKMAQALKWNRLFGGAGIIVCTGQDWESEFDPESLAQDDPLEFLAVDMWELFWDKQNTESYDQSFQNDQFTHYTYYGKKIHKSRVMVLKGITAPSMIRPRLRGWGLSVVEVLVRSINQYLKANDLTFEVLDEFKIDIFKIKNLANTLLAPDGTTLIRNRVQLANQQKNYQNAITMDAEDDYLQKELSFTGLAETMVGIRMQIASDLRMPLTKVFGISASGFSSGEDDIENYNAMVEGQIRQKSKHHIIKMVKMRCQQLFGYIPDDIQVEFKPLRILSAEQEENVKNSKFNRLLAALNAGAIGGKEFKDACNRDKLFSVTLDTSVDLLEPPNQEQEGDGNGEVEAKKAPKSKTQSPEAKT